MVKDIPHGHGASYKRGIIDSLLESEDYDGPYTPNETYQTVMMNPIEELETKETH